MERLWNSNYIKVWIANFMLFFAFYLILPLLPLFLSDRFGADKNTIGVVLSGYTLMALLIRLFSGYLVDTFDRRKVLLLCYFFFALFFAGYFICSTLVLFAIVRTFHGLPFGATTVANSTMMIDVLPSSRRAEGIGYYGLSNNIAMAVAPSVGLYLYTIVPDFNILFGLSLAIASTGFVIDCTIKHRQQVHTAKHNHKVSLDRFFLVKGLPAAITMACLSFTFGVVTTYLAIYSRDVMHITAGSGAWFALMATGLAASRIIGGRTLRKGLVVENATAGMTLAMVGFFLFVALPNSVGYYSSAIIVGLGNGHMFPAMQNMFLNLAPHDRRGTANSSLLTAWDTGIGGGIILGGVVSENLSYTHAFWAAALVNALGVAFFWLYVRRHYKMNKLR